jgi:hypothetical protein
VINGLNFGLITATNVTNQTLTLATAAPSTQAATADYAIESVLADGNVHTATIAYTIVNRSCDGACSNQLTVTLDGNVILTTTIDIVFNVLGGTDGAYVGFTGSNGTGDGTETDNQDILSWTYDTAQSYVATGGAQSFIFNYPNWSFEADVPAGMLAAGSTVTDYPQDCDTACWTKLSCPGPYCGSTLLPVTGLPDPAGTNDGIIDSVVCLYLGSPCINSTPYNYNVLTTTNSPLNNYCNDSPALFKGDPVFGDPANGGEYDYLADTLTSCMQIPKTDPTWGSGGTSQCTSKAITDCLSGWANGLNVTGPAASASITFPVNGATYVQNEVLPDYAFTCSPAPNPPTGPVLSCGGTLTNANFGPPPAPGGVENVTITQAVDTSTLGANTVTVGAQANMGYSSGSATVTYYVTNSYTFAFDPPVSPSPALNVAHAGQQIPVKFDVSDANGNPVLGLKMPLVSIGFVPAACASLDALDDTTIPVSDIVTSGLTELGSGDYLYAWKTPTSLAGTCGQLQINLGDGTLHTADFKFK